MRKSDSALESVKIFDVVRFTFERFISSSWLKFLLVVIQKL